MNSTEIFNHGKKTWSARCIDSSAPFIRVVTNTRNKVCHKERYELKINDVKMTCKREFPTVSNRTKKGVAVRLQSDMKIPSELNEVQDMIEIRCIANSSKSEQMPAETLKFIKKQRILARKVSLTWSKYSTSSRVSSDTGFSEISSAVTDPVTSVRDRFLQIKYSALWKTFIKQARARREQSKTRSHSQTQLLCRKINESFNKNNKVEKLKFEDQQQKIQEQADLIKELQLARIKLEEELFAKETQEIKQMNNRKHRIKSSPTEAIKEVTNRQDPSSRFKYDRQLVLKMELRATERKQRWDCIRERKRLLEAAKEEKIRLEAERKKEHEEEQKRLKIFRVKEEKKRKEELKREQELERLHLNELNKTAVHHHQQFLLKSSFQALVLFLKQRRMLMRHAEEHYKKKLFTRMFTSWKLFWKVGRQKRNGQADELYETCLLRNSFECLKKIYLEYQRKLDKSKSFNAFYLLRNHFNKWVKITCEQKCIQQEKENMAAQYYETSLMRRYFQNWKHLPMALFHDREKEHKFRLWCNKVKEFLPDFEPSHELG